MSDVVPAGVRLRFKADMVLHVVGTPVARVSNSELDSIAQRMQARGYSDIARNSSYSEVTLDATVAVNKPNLETTQAEFYTAADEGVFNCWPSNIRVAVVYHPRDHAGQPAPRQQLYMPPPAGNPLENLLDPGGGWLLPLLLVGGIVVVVATRR